MQHHFSQVPAGTIAANLGGQVAYLQHAITKALLAGPCAASTAVARRPQVHSAHVAVDVQEEHSLNVIRQGQWLTITNDLSAERQARSGCSLRTMWNPLLGWAKLRHSNRCMCSNTWLLATSLSVRTRCSRGWTKSNLL